MITTVCRSNRNDEKPRVMPELLSLLDLIPEPAGNRIAKGRRTVFEHLRIQRCRPELAELSELGAYKLTDAGLKQNCGSWRLRSSANIAAPRRVGVRRPTSSESPRPPAPRPDQPRRVPLLGSHDQTTSTEIRQRSLS